MSNVVLVTGGFDSIHKGHIEYFKEEHNVKVNAF